jgi:predicted DNA repair protein MutK
MNISSHIKLEKLQWQCSPWLRSNFINRKDKIKSAIVTDFILSVEIVIIALGTVLDQPILKQVLVVTFIAILAL